MKLSQDEIKFLEDKALIAKNPHALLSLMDQAILSNKTDVRELNIEIEVLLILLKDQVERGMAHLEVPQRKNFFDETIEEIQFYLNILSKISMIGQGWYINPMKAAGYSLKDGGHCFGMTHMAMQAFLVDEDMKAFNERLIATERTPEEDFKNNFTQLRSKQNILRQEGKIEEASEINQFIVDMQAFFDGIALYQSTKRYQHLFETPVKGQDAAKTMQITRPVSLDSEESRPVLMSCDSGAYNQSELGEYLALMENKLGKNSFALTISSALHAMSLNYSPYARDSLTSHIF